MQDGKESETQKHHLHDMLHNTDDKLFAGDFGQSVHHHKTKTLMEINENFIYAHPACREKIMFLPMAMCNSLL